MILAEGCLRDGYRMTIETLGVLKFILQSMCPGNADEKGARLPHSHLSSLCDLFYRTFTRTQARRRLQLCDQKSRLGSSTGVIEPHTTGSMHHFLIVKHTRVLQSFSKLLCSMSMGLGMKHSPAAPAAPDTPQAQFITYHVRRTGWLEYSQLQRHYFQTHFTIPGSKAYASNRRNLSRVVSKCPYLTTLAQIPLRRRQQAQFSPSTGVRNVRCPQPTLWSVPLQARITGLHHLRPSVRADGV